MDVGGDLELSVSQSRGSSHKSRLGAVSHMAAVTSQVMELSVTWQESQVKTYGAVSHVAAVTSQVSESERRENTTSDE